MRENTANCEQIRSEIEKIQWIQEEFAKKKEIKKTTAEPAVARSRTESRMEVHEAPRASGRFNLDRVSQEKYERGPGSMDNSRASFFHAQSREKPN